MILSIAAIDDPALLASVQARVGKLEWHDGRATAGAVAKEVKRNEQAVMASDAGRALEQVLKPIIADNPVVKAAARPRRITRLMISKTRDGGFYGPHVDNAIMGQGEERLRTDLSFTLFLTSPDHYEGGELVVHSSGMTQSIKGEAGQLVLYPSSSIHEVTPVTSGERIVCVGWIESLIADHASRELLFDMENLRVSLRQSMPGNSPELLTLDKTIANLIRMWAHP
jgi:PKHD-type hydroxylase